MAVTAATGFFDGVHLGHRKVLERVRSIALERGEESVAITFWPHPAVVLAGREVDLLTSLEEKKRLILECGISRVEVIDFTREFAALPARDFIERYLKERFDVGMLVLGYDHSFGSDRFASVEQLASLVRECGLGAEIVGQFRLQDGTVVNSSAVRRALESGDLELASKMLGR